MTCLSRPLALKLVRFLGWVAQTAFRPERRTVRSAVEVRAGGLTPRRSEERANARAAGVLC
jgi:hypothetical protein